MTEGGDKTRVENIRSGEWREREIRIAVFFMGFYLGRWVREGLLGMGDD